MIIVDSGLGGISVVRALKSTHPELTLTYVADTASFPYGNRSPEMINLRARALIRKITILNPGSPIVLACNTLSTLCLEPLRAAFPEVTFIGTVPAIKTAASISKSRRFTLLATPNTAAGRYTQELIGEFAGDCVVDCYGAPNLAAMIEALLLGEEIADNALRQEILPAFCNDGLGRTDCLVLGCTHYPLITARLQALAPWPVQFVDSSEAIARRALSFGDAPPAESIAYVTSRQDVARYASVFAREGFGNTDAFIV